MQRLDQALVAQGIAETRSKARDLVQRGSITVNGIAVTKPGKPVRDDDQLSCSKTEPGYVSRGGLKLAAALVEYGFKSEGAVAIDVGASTGGFTDVLLRGDATHVYAVDVGREQIHPTLRDDARVTVLEGTDARTLDVTTVDRPVTAVVCDASFISLTKVLPSAMALAQDGAWMIALIKPQFELEPTAIGKGGIVRSEVDQKRAVSKVLDWVDATPGWQHHKVITSPITGKGGNTEFLIGATFNG